MAGRVARLYRHPIKGHGVEQLPRAELSAGAGMPGDRVWAIAHDAARIGPGHGGWATCANFARGSKTPDLMAIRAALDEATGAVRLEHPRLAPITVKPDVPADAARLIAWAAALGDADRAQPAFVVRAGRAMTDSDWPSVSILGSASLAALGARMGRPLAMERFRGNIWVEGLAPWEEFGWIGRELSVGGAVLRVRERITRCKATTVDPETGRIDADTLGALREGWGHQDFGVYAEVIAGGPVAPGDPVRA